VLKRDRTRADASLYITGRDIEEPSELALEFDPNAATWAIVGDAEEYRLSEQRAAILRVLRDSDEPLGPTDITEMVNANGTKVTNGTVRVLLGHMVRDGQIGTPGRGKYVPLPSKETVNNINNVTNEDTGQVGWDL
jgi:hypothetical protein